MIVADHPDKKVVATMQLTFIPNLNRKGSKRMQIEAVRVDNNFRNQGIGAKMINFAFIKGREQNCKIAQLTTDNSRDDARRFYEKLGFKASHLGMKINLSHD
jgi:ribosomal protein S18 acetylase RimI-like enzyme